MAKTYSLMELLFLFRFFLPRTPFSWVLVDFILLGTWDWLWWMNTCYGTWGTCLQVGLSRLLMSTRLGNFEESLENPKPVQRFLDLRSFLDCLELKFCGHLGNSIDKACAKFQLNQSSFDQVLTFSLLVRAAENRLRWTLAPTSAGERRSSAFKRWTSVPMH